MIALLNTSIITSEGDYKYTSQSDSEVASAINEALGISGDQDSDFFNCGLVSHIGHESTANVMTELFRDMGVDYAVKPDRTPYSQGVGDAALVFKLNGRPPEGKILTAEEIREIGYSWGWLYRTA